MTGFGSAEGNGFRVEIRSSNHRFIDISMKMPLYLSQHEIPLKSILKEKFHRGKFDVLISTNSPQPLELRINKGLAKKIYTALYDLKEELSIPGQIDINTIAGYGGLLIEDEPKYNIDALYATFHEAVSNLEEMRIREGKRLCEEIRSRVQSLNIMNNKIGLLFPHVVTKWREKFSERISSILGESIDERRIAQEAAIMSEKLDISEEVSRIESHIREFIDVLNKDNIAGRKLDFLLQEINREVNTIASKANDYTISSIAVEMKTEIERMRQQIQNIQ